MKAFGRISRGGDAPVAANGGGAPAPPLRFAGAFFLEGALACNACFFSGGAAPRSPRRHALSCDAGGFRGEGYESRVLGQFFTPADIVDKMLALRCNHGSVLEPAAGAGAFLSRLEAGAVGIEIDANIGFADGRLLRGDFFAYSTTNKFDTIIGNPPYVRFQDIEASVKALLPMDMFDRRSNLYLFFIAKCVEHLEDGGELIFITPRDFLKLTAARKLNEHLYSQGSMTHYFELGDASIFHNAVPNCAIWRWEKGRRRRRMRTGGDFCCRNGQIWFGKRDTGGLLGDCFDIKVGAVSGADDVFASDAYGNVDMVCSRTATSGETRRMLYNRKHRILLPHKRRLLNRKVRQFDESNWWKWGRNYCAREGERIYVNGKTRNRQPFFVSEVEAYDGSVLALFPREGVDCGAAAERLNGVDWEGLGFVCDGRLLFTQRSLALAPVGV